MKQYYSSAGKIDGLFVNLWQAQEIRTRNLPNQNAVGIN